MLTLKKIISRNMRLITWILAFIQLIVIIFLQIISEQKRAYETSTRTFTQIEQVLNDNQKEIEKIEAEYTQTCLHNTEAVAFILESNPDFIYNIEELNKVAKYIEVDEIHIFDKTGCIISGTNPEYYGYTFNSGEQISFFKPLLTDKSLKLVQEITPNTAEHRLMQYSALWSNNNEFIVQVGMEPTTIMELTAKNELSYMFSLFRVDPEVNYYAINVDDGKIVGSTDLNCVGQSYSDIGLDIKDLANDDDGFHAYVNGHLSFCAFKKIGSNYIGRVALTQKIYERIPHNILLFTLCLITVAFILIFVVTRNMNKYVVDEIHIINEKLHSIAGGNLEESVNIYSSKEFSQLSNYINAMIESILSNNKKMSYVLSKTNLYIGVYEYNSYMKKVKFTEYIPRIFHLDELQAEQLSSDHTIFKKFISNILSNPVSNEKGTYKLGTTDHYVKLEEFNDSNGTFGVVIDVTPEMMKRNQIQVERDIDSLTGLFNRRGLDTKLSILFSEPEKLGYSAIIMIDADNLKVINDTYGHDKGDIYIKKIATIINDFGQRNTITARYGGDEFVLFLYGYKDKDDLIVTIHALEHIQNNISAHLDDNLEVELNFSFGYALTEENKNYLNLLKEADAKMYENKRERKGNKTLKQ